MLSPRTQDYDLAKSWGMTPPEWDNLEPRYQDEMRRHDRLKRRMELFQAAIREANG